MTVIEPAFVAETLAWCNEIRAEKDMEPLACLPKGLRRDPLSCPCGKATGLRVGLRYFGSPHGDGYEKPLPNPVEMFVAAFDEGQLPQYDDEAPAPGGRYPYA